MKQIFLKPIGTLRNLGTAPVVAWHMGRFATFSLLVNLVAVPLSSLCMVLGLVMLGASNLRQQRRLWTVLGRPDMIKRSNDERDEDHERDYDQSFRDQCFRRDRHSRLTRAPFRPSV